MKLSLAYIMLTLTAAVAVGTIVGTLDYRASLNEPLRPSETPSRPAVTQPADRDVKTWPACEDASPGQACQYFDDFDSDGDNTIGYFPRGM